ncbi:creatininase family protein [Desulfoluna butyratoxydans]|uniref:Creatininase/formamide hydrolase n=1 Tax=Desulfoluna butyratoxydans TaxID=231438 RepID=A0A4U8YQ01_9BACT|nr:creatininase family protein [Desulfoluna butyratoxydans]VFQ45891.1 creatininase/formamide hydrolase [Desulfoluna butyratoxydans]
MKIADMNWFQVESYLKADDRVVLPLGSTEQHAYLSLCTDFILSNKLAVETGEGCGVPVYPGLPYGIAPYFSAYPGTVTIRPETYGDFVTDILNSLVKSGFRRVLIINGHGGNSPVEEIIRSRMATVPECQILFHNWWSSEDVMGAVHAVSPNASHASWMENFPWTRLERVSLPPREKAPCDPPNLRQLPPTEVRSLLGDGNYGGAYQADDDAMLSIWRTAVAETTKLLDTGWEN